MSYDLLLKNAVSLHQAGRLDEAENEYRRLLVSMPDNPDLLHLLGMIASQRGAFSSGIPHLFSAVKLSPETVSYRFTLAHALFASGHPHEALEHYTEVLKRDASLPDTYNNMGSIYQSLNDFEKAEEFFKKAVDLSPTYAPAYINLGILRREQNQTDEALSLFEKAIELAPEEPDGYAQKALTLRLTDKNEEALIFYDKALQKDDKNPVLINGKGVALESLNRLEEAKKAYTQALNLSPRFSDAYNNRANIYVKLGEKWLAEDDYKEALSIDPKYVQAMTNLGALLFQTERYEEALEYYRKAFLIDPKQPQALNNLAMAVKMSGDYEEAIGLFFQALVLAPDLKTIHHNLAVALFELHTKENRPEEARQLAEKWSKSYPHHDIARHLSASFSGKTPKESETPYLKEFFDSFASSFDETLSALDYRLPVLIRNKIRQICAVHEKVSHILDLGCGTGLCADAMRQNAQKLTGVDLSAQMLEKAKQKKVYDDLIEADLAVYLPENPSCFDMIVCADVACYLGDLSAFINGGFTALRSGGHLLFSVEKSDKQTDFFLCPTGRFVHSEKYVRSVLVSAGFDILSVSSEFLRKENDEPVNGYFFIARKQEELDKTRDNA